MKLIKTKSLNRVNKKKIVKIMNKEQIFKIKKYHLKNQILMITNHNLANQKIAIILKPKNPHLSLSVPKKILRIKIVILIIF